MKPNFFTSFGGNNGDLGLLDVVIMTLDVIAALTVFSFSKASVASVTNVLSNTIAGAPKLNTTRRTFDSLHRVSTPSVTTNCTVTCPVNILNIVLSFVVLECTLHVGGDRRRTTTGHNVKRLRTVALGAFSMGIAGRVMFNSAVGRVERVLGHSFVISGVVHGGDSGRSRIMGKRARVGRNSVLRVMTGPAMRRPIVTLLNRGIRIDRRGFNRSLVAHHVHVAGPNVGNGDVDRLRVHAGLNTGVAQMGHGNISLVTAPRLGLRLNSHIAIINARLTVTRARGMLNGRVGHLGCPGLVPVFLNVVLNYVITGVPFFVPNVGRGLHLNLANNPLMMTVLVNCFNPGCGLIACGAVSTGLVLHRVNVYVFLTYIKLNANRRFVRAITSRDKVA